MKRSRVASVSRCGRSSRLGSIALVLRISRVQPLDRRLVRLTLTDGSVVDRDLGGLLDGVGVFRQISIDDDALRRVEVEAGTLAWPGGCDIAPETLIWDGPDPREEGRRPEPFFRPRRPGSAGI